MGPKQLTEMQKALREFIAENGEEWPRALVLADGAPGAIGKLRGIAWTEIESWASSFDAKGR